MRNLSFLKNYCNFRLLESKLGFLTRLSRQVSTVLLSLVLPCAAFAQYNDISVNGEPIGEEVFAAYIGGGLPVADYCFPNTEQHIINFVVKRQLVINAGLAAGNEASSNFGAWEPPDSQTTSDELAYRYYVFNAMLDSQFEEHKKQITGDDKTVNVRERYLAMLAEDHPFVVDVALFRVAELPMGSFAEAQQVVQRIVDGESIEDIASDFGGTGSSVIEQSSRWRHAATLPVADGENLPEVGALFGPHYYSKRWYVGKILETKKSPVFLLQDELRRYESLQNRLDGFIKNENYEALVKRLWESSEVTIDGQNVPHPSGNLCNDTLL